MEQQIAEQRPVYERNVLTEPDGSDGPGCKHVVLWGCKGLRRRNLGILLTAVHTPVDHGPPLFEPKRKNILNKTIALTGIALCLLPLTAFAAPAKTTHTMAAKK